MFSKKQGTGALQIGAPICGIHMGGNLGKPPSGGQSGAPHLEVNLGCPYWESIWGVTSGSQSGGPQLESNLRNPHLSRNTFGALLSSYQMGWPILAVRCGIPGCPPDGEAQICHIGTDTQFGSLGHQ